MFILFSNNIQLDNYFLDPEEPNNMVVLISRHGCANIMCKEAFGKINIGTRGGITGRVRYGYSNMMGSKNIDVRSIKDILNVMK
jgi:hypothetical protein